MNKLWGGRFEQGMDQKVEAFNASIDVDQALFTQDIEGSIAHVKMLKKQAIIPSTDADSIINGLLELKEEHANQPLTFSKSYEDIHLNIEMLLHEKIGEVAGKMHTGRSRNDQVATDMHLYTNQKVQQLIKAIQAFQSTIVQVAKSNIDVIIPGYTHLQRAQPILFSHHLLTYFWMLQRDRDRLADSIKRINISPLGSGALAGTTYPTDQRYTQSLLNFDDVYPNSIDAVSDRDYILETMNNINLIMMHLSRFAEEIILWCSHEFNFVTLSDAYSTGSSIMPQKKNPDMAELIRGKSGTVSGHYIGLLMTLKGLPLAYNKDLQEDKQHFFEALQTCIDSVDIFNGMIETMTLNKTVIEKALNNDFSNATELADYLVTLNIPFRKAHELTGLLVKQCIDKGIYLLDVPLSTYQAIHSEIDETVYEYLKPLNAVNRRQNENGTSTQSVLGQIKKAEALL
ncbi:argininosuccinate lyase [Macrococcus sp. DPC7161]|uniref:argininosuccinate lyase n=1 Tax=Macrococcus sp. DPC7161 TaxID=2507060 RepID=UPI00100A261A|nr:argininosuccinate lyase [Macrococcus sp. DPC7161]RXK18731.1 argininosuccinate lyase [Macrococcus sp. DPC7161]